jgi:6-phosphogluconolactonase
MSGRPGDGTAGEPDLVVLPDPETVSQAAAERIAQALTAAVDERGVAHWVTTGGSAPGSIYRHLSTPELRAQVPWSRVHVWWTDDRFVPYDHPLSNVRLVDTILVPGTGRFGVSDRGASGSDPGPGQDTGVPLPAENLHPFPTAEAIGRGETGEWCAERYAEEIRAAGVPVVGGWPAFDVYLIGVGPDGHLLSVFPDSEAFDRDEWAMGIPAPTHVEPHVARVTLHPATLDVAGTLISVVHGEGKEEILGRIFGPERDVRRLPAQLARRRGAVWYLDQAAAAGIPGAT